jgi:hypothetical protein
MGQLDPYLFFSEFGLWLRVMDMDLRHLSTEILNLAASKAIHSSAVGCRKGEDKHTWNARRLTKA